MTHALSETAKRAADNEEESSRRYTLVSEGLAVAKKLSTALRKEEEKAARFEQMLMSAIDENRILKNTLNSVNLSKQSKIQFHPYDNEMKSLE